MKPAFTITCAYCGRTVPREHGAYQTYCTADCRKRDTRRRKRRARAVQQAVHPLRTRLYANRERNMHDRRSREAASRAESPDVPSPTRCSPASCHAMPIVRARKRAVEAARWHAMGTLPALESERAA